MSLPVSFRFHPRVLSALGRDLVTSDIVAVMELVKNSYDAMATRVEVRIRAGGAWSDPAYIEIIDDGHGMDYDTIRDVWFVIATPFRNDHPASKMGSRSRAVTGDKGLGRLSAARLGRDLQVTTKTPQGPVLDFSLNWEEIIESENLTEAAFSVSQLPVESFEGTHGTRIRISGLNNEWNATLVHDLRENLARFVSPFAGVEDFSLHLDAIDDQGETSLEEVSPPPFMSQPKYKIAGTVDVTGSIRSAYEYRPIGHQVERCVEINKSWEELYNGFSKENKANLSASKSGCGPFKFEIRAWDLTRDDTRDIAEHFDEERRYIRDAISSKRGVSVYRDDVLVLPKSESTRDWLRLDIRRISRVGPRLGTSQVVGYVRITKSENPGIVDTSDREGLVVNPATIAFRRLITEGVLRLLEQERHIDRFAEDDSGSVTDLFAGLSTDRLVADIKGLKNGTVTDALRRVEKFGAELQRSRIAIEKRFGYYNRLAVIGTIAQLVIHEIRNRTTVIGRGLRKARELAEQVQNAKVAKPLKMATESVTSLDALANRFAPLANRNYRSGRHASILEDSVIRCVAMLKDEIRSHRISVVHPTNGQTTVRIHSGELDAIILNLLSNSVYWLRGWEGDRRVHFRFEQGANSHRVAVFVDDSGPGIKPDDIDRVFWPGVTRKPDGIGMGLTVAAELVEGHGGEMRTIFPGSLEGASFEFDLPLAK